MRFLWLNSPSKNVKLFIYFIRSKLYIIFFSLFYFNYGTNFKCRWSKWFPADETLCVIDLEVEELVLGGSGKPYVFLTEEIARRRQGANMKREDRLGTIKNLPRIIEAVSRTLVLMTINCCLYV